MSAMELDLSALPMDEDAIKREIARVQAELQTAAAKSHRKVVVPDPNFVGEYEQHVRHMDEEQIKAEIARIQTELAPPVATPVTETTLCLCKQPSDNNMIACDSCDRWYHMQCVGLSFGEANCIERFVCPRCHRTKRKRARTTYKTKEETTEELNKEIDTMDVPMMEAEIARVEEELRKLERAQVEADAAAAAAAAVVAQKSTLTPVPDAGAEEDGDQDGEGVHDMRLCDAVRAAMHELGLSQTEVVEQSGITGGQGALSSWLNGKHTPRVEDKQKQLRAWLRQINRTVPDLPDANGHFYHKYNKGDRIDAQDYEGNWFEGIVLDVKPGLVKIHYKMWNAMYDEWVPTRAKRLAPLGTHTGTKSAKRKKPSSETPKIANNVHKKPNSGSKPRRKHGQADEDNNVDICVICGQGGQLLCCDGCPSAYHGRCFVPPLNPYTLPEGEWYCPDCEEAYKRIPVWIPGKTGVIRGVKAPFKKDLEKWLSTHPGYEVWTAQKAMAWVKDGSGAKAAGGHSGSDTESDPD